LRAESESLFREDPLRLLRAIRLAAQLDFSIEPETLKMMGRLRKRVSYPAGERVQAELMALLSVPSASTWLRLMDENGLLTALFPELEAARTCALDYYGPGGVLKHSLDTAQRADFLLQNLGRVFPDEAAALTTILKERSHYPSLLMLAALIHDVSKPETAKIMGGRLRFFGHDLRGADRAAQIMNRLRFSRSHIQSVSAIVGNHLRPGHLAAGGPVTDKAAYRFFRDLGSEAAGLLLVCWADHASYLDETRLKKLLKMARAEPGTSLKAVPEDARKTILHLQVTALLLRRLLSPSRPAVPEPLLDGHEVMRATRLAPGPKIGEILERLREAQAEGAVSTRQEALIFIKKRKE
jgi:tRNA nucleotidyltransferase/poly(A) polymerase